MTTIPFDYEQRVYAGWLGKCIGVHFGAPIEGWIYHEIRDHLGVVENYLPLPEGKLFQPDDDTSLPMLLIRALDHYGPNVTAAQLGDTWLNYLGVSGDCVIDVCYLRCRPDAPWSASGRRYGPHVPA